MTNFCLFFLNLVEVEHRVARELFPLIDPMELNDAMSDADSSFSTAVNASTPDECKLSNNAVCNFRLIFVNDTHI